MVWGSSRLPTILIDQRTVLREGLARILASRNFPILGQFASALEADTVVSSGGCRLARPAGRILVILASERAAEATADHVAVVTRRFGYSRVVVMADRYEPEEAKAALNAGADGYLLSTMACEVLVESLVRIGAGRRIRSSANGDAEEKRPTRGIAAASRPLTSPYDLMLRRFTGRELQVARLLTEGCSNKLIAQRLALTEATVKVYLKSILKKIPAKNRTQAALWATTCFGDASPSG
jgi:two-component system nitrate/nitrite response regulator NarL